MYLIVQLPHYKRTYDHIYQIEKYIRALYRKLVLFLQSKIVFATYQRMRANMKSWAGTRLKTLQTAKMLEMLNTHKTP